MTTCVFSNPVNIGPPTNFEVVATGTESLQISWEAPYDSADLNILSYTISCDPQFHDEISVTVPVATTIVLESQFIPGTTYTCSVYATNADGNGIAAEATAITLEGQILAIQILIYQINYVFDFCLGEGFLPFLILGDGKMYLPYGDDAVSDSIDIFGGMSTGDTVHTRAYVSFF